MIHKAFASRLYYRLCCFVLFFLAASSSFNGYYQKWHFGEAGVSGEDERFSFEAMVDGTANRPWVYRQFLPACVNWLEWAAPAPVKTWLSNGHGFGADPLEDYFFDSETAANPAYSFRYLLLYVATFLSALLAVYAMYLVCRAVGSSPPTALFAPIIVILLVPYIESQGGYFYDYPELAFFALAAWIALRFDWGWIIPVAALGTWNKETFLLFVPTLYPLMRQRSSRRGASLAVGVLSLVCVAVHYPIRLSFAHNPGGAMEMHWRDQLHWLMQPWQLLFATEKTYGTRALRAFTLIPMAMLAWAVSRVWGSLPRALQRHAQIAAAINIPLYLLFCWPGEMRDLSLLYVVFLLVVASNLNEWSELPRRLLLRLPANAQISGQAGKTHPTAQQFPD
jgi:hypothetical protein